MLCSDCKVDEATEFFNEFGKAVKQGKCRPCYERAVCDVAIGELPIRGWTFRGPGRKKSTPRK